MNQTRVRDRLAGARLLRARATRRGDRDAADAPRPPPRQGAVRARGGGLDWPAAGGLDLDQPSVRRQVADPGRRQPRRAGRQPPAGSVRQAGLADAGVGQPPDHRLGATAAAGCRWHSGERTVGDAAAKPVRPCSEIVHTPPPKLSAWLRCCRSKHSRPSGDSAGSGRPARSPSPESGADLAEAISRLSATAASPVGRAAAATKAAPTAARTA